MTDQPVEEIARGLSEAQRRALIERDDDICSTDEWAHILQIGLIKIDRWRQVFTDVGWAVRRYLMEQG